MSQPLTVECEVHFDREHRGRKRLQEGAAGSQRLGPSLRAWASRIWGCRALHRRMSSA